ncbi:MULTISPECIES: PaaI family thioesterase [Rhodococcus]|uniref:PaaI family thioesterase n=1 Tax=Rhodococcus TaxID=1827 RepID=UPI001E37CE69|nr:MULTISPECIES: PaaI family thioesterase [Rhodococcus]MCD2104392.1 PaaI family thioesterase [Rhodococcus qingshengii]MCZ4523447.1 PaaI family thioesterase [Rhodococcus erythropolis]MDV8009572.1 PaaI family thioesterase [Rhodococcus sp. IEGM 1318]
MSRNQSPVGLPRATPTGVDLPLTDELNAMLQGRLPGLIGMRIRKASAESVIADLTVREELLAPNGYLHAATVVALADTACGIGTRLALADGDSFTTLEIKTNYLGTARSGMVTAVATPVHCGRRTHLWDASVLDEEGRRIAEFRCTQLVIRPRMGPELKSMEGKR